ncbi:MULTISPECIES: LLM class flavin-dependent oxidoreductase [unclassified Rhodococcus (in: high G+C Gram-positive bacteria)]|uniref:LLM class flavin-dependent oxidoreductase n=1 Tax=unclassified Rhodococcus (in: high G+C Gram-positive bacteria) TaxID=192944 RepID=UPI0009EA57BC|nr:MULTISPECIES: LLM class flavin-dependent oxidoreductase [unclassified Rhodococcus (in: high G+C Gram-positive bacteria)]
MKLGVFLPSRGRIATLPALKETALAAERLGYESVWVGDHLSYGEAHANHSPSYQKDRADNAEMNYYEGHTTLSYLAGLTERVKLGMAVLAVPIRDPRVYAKEALTLQTLSDGRLVIGCGMGDYVGDFALTGRSKKNRVSMTEEYLDCLNSLLQGGEVSYEGKTVSVEKAYFFPKTAKIPLLYGGGVRFVGEGDDREFALADKAIRRAAQYCDGMMPYGPPELVVNIQDTARDIAATEFGRKMEHETVVMGHHALVYRTDEEAREAAAPFRANSAIPFHESDIIGGVETAAAKLQSYVDAGIDHLILMFSVATVDEQLEMMNLIAEEVVPLLKP